MPDLTCSDITMTRQAQCSQRAQRLKRFSDEKRASRLFSLGSAGTASRWWRAGHVAEKKDEQNPSASARGRVHERGRARGVSGSAPALVSAPQIHRGSKVVARLSLKMNCEGAAPATYLNGTLEANVSQLGWNMKYWTESHDYKDTVYRFSDF